MALHRGLGIPGLDDGIRETWPDKASVQRDPETAAPLGVPYNRWPAGSPEASIPRRAPSTE